MTELNLLDYIEPNDLKEFYNKIQNLFPVCLKCQKPVFLKNMKEDKIVKMKIECPFCNNNETLTLNDYIKKLEELIPAKNNCENHKDKLCYGFCQDCNIWLCKDCFIEHIPKNHYLYQSQFKIRPTCCEHPNEKASFYNTQNNLYLCNKCNFKPLLNQLTNAFYYNLQDDQILSNCYRCLHYDFIITEARKDLFKLESLIEEILGEKENDLAKEKSEKIEKAYNLINNNIKEVRFNNLFIANCYLKNMPNYHVFKNIKNNMGENHTTFWAFNDMIYDIEDKEKDMTKETLLELIDKFINICENNLTTGIHSKLSEDNMFDLIDESDLKVEELKCCKINYDNVSNGFVLEKNKSFLIHGRNYFAIYDSNTFEILQDSKFDKDITYISIIDSKRFLVSFEKSYELYTLKDNNIYKSEKNIELQEVNIDEFKKEMGIVDKKEKKKKRTYSDGNIKDELEKKDESEDDKEVQINPKFINSSISAITLLKDETKIACGQGTLITIREFETGKLIKTLAKHEGFVEILFIYDKYLVSCCSCNKICFWNLNTFNLIKQVDAEISSPTSYIIIDEYLITCGSMIGYKINLLFDFVVEGTFSGNFLLIHAIVQINDFEILIATKDYSTHCNNFYLINLYNILGDENEPVLHMKNVHNNICEGCIKIDDKRFVTISRDCTFKVWAIKDEEKSKENSEENSKEKSEENSEKNF